MSRPTNVRIDPAAFLHNLKVVKFYAKNARIMAMVKANAYGHGILPLIQALQSVDAVGVSCLEEALELRDLGFRQPIVLLEGFFKADELDIIAEMQLEIVLHQPYQLQILQQAKLKTSLKIWLKINTGMNRLGFPIDQIADLFDAIQKIPAIEKPINWMSHFSDADDLTAKKNQQQLDLFQHITKPYDGFKSLANSAAILSNPASHFDWVRPGIMLYGVSPFTEKSAAAFNLKPVMTLSSNLIAINQVKKGEAIGYNSTFICPEDMSVGVIAMGYGDGYPRHAKTGTPVLVNGIRVPLIGRVSMDMIAVDLRQCKTAQVEDPVILWGEGLPVEEIAHSANTIAYELLCHINTKNVRLHFLN